VSDVEEQLAWEAEQRPRASAVAIGAGVLTLLGNVLFLLVARGGPGPEDGQISLTEALGARLQGQAPAEESLFLRQAQYYGDNVVPFSLTTILTALAVVLLGLTLAFLYRATAARLPAVGRLPIVMTVIGTVCFVVGRLVGQLAAWIAASGLADDATVQDARDAIGSATVLVGQALEQIGLFALGVGIALVALNAMRAGLLTRFLGILGVIVGILAVPIFPLDQPQIVRAFWLVAVGWVVVAGRGSAGLLPAWQTGRAEPWPTQQQLREQREAAAGRKPRVPEPAPEPAGGEGAVSAGAPRRKRKRRK
jgi:hypothetical protein